MRISSSSSNETPPLCCSFRDCAALSGRRKLLAGRSRVIKTRSKLFCGRLHPAEKTHTHTHYSPYTLSLYPSLLLYRYVLHVARGCRWSGAAGRQLYYIRGRGIEPERFSCERPTLWNDPPYTHPNGQTSPTPKSAVFYWGDIYKSFIGGTWYRDCRSVRACPSRVSVYVREIPPLHPECVQKCVRPAASVLKKKTYSQRSVELYNADRHFSINRATFDLPINRRSIIRRIRRYVQHHHRRLHDFWKYNGPRIYVTYIHNATACRTK